MKERLSLKKIYDTVGSLYLVYILISAIAFVIYITVIGVWWAPIFGIFMALTMTYIIRRDILEKYGIVKSKKPTIAYHKSGNYFLTDGSKTTKSINREDLEKRQICKACDEINERDLEYCMQCGSHLNPIS